MRIRRIWLPILAAIAMVAPLAGQDASAPKPDAGHITGTVIDAGGDTLSGATVILRSPNLKAPRSILSDDNGSFEFRDLDSGTYQVTVTAPDFADWTKTDINLDAGQFLILTDIKMHIAKTVSTVTVNGSSVEVATEQVKIEEQQRVFGIIPNFYVVYDPNPVPLTTKLKFQLALKTSADPFTIAGVGVLAAINQAGNTPDYVQGWKGYGERAGAAAADGFSDIMLGGAILPALLHQDPRYYYQGAGTDRSRALHALSSPFICKGDNGHWQPNFSSMGGDLGSAALSNLYYPRPNRGAGLVFQNFGLSTAERMVSTLVQEFVIRKLALKSQK